MPLNTASKIFFRLISSAGLFIPASHAGEIYGSVKASAGQAVSGAQIVLFRQGGGPAPLGKTASDQTGSFRFAGTPAEGNLLIEVTAPGFGAVSVSARADAHTTVVLAVSAVHQRIFVTAEGSAQTIDQVSKAASVIGGEEIDQRNEYSVSEALRDVPGMLIRNLGGPGQATSVRIRGLRADATAMLIDGLRFRDVATTQADASSFLSTLNVINLDRVEVLRGSGSSLYGTNAVGGTVNVVTDAGGGRRHGAVLMEGGSLGLLRGRATLSGGLRDDRLTYSAGLLHLNVMSGVDGDDRARSSGAQSFARYTVSGRTSISGRFLFSDDFVQPNLSPTSTGIPAANIPNTTIVEAIPISPDQLRNSAAGLAIAPGSATYIPNRNDPDNRRASRFATAAAILRHAIHPGADVQGSYSRVDTDRYFQNGPAGAGTQPRVSNYSRFRGAIDTADARLNLRPAPWSTLTGGYEFEREDYLNVDDNRLPAPGAVSTRTKAGQRAHAAYFASQSSLLNQRLQVSLSGRMQSFATRQPVFRYAGAANNYDAVAVQSPPRALTGDIALSYFHAASATKLRAHGGNSYRAPGLYERYGSGFSYNATTNAVLFSPYGDPRLAPDRYNSVDAGVDQYLFGEKLRASATWFYTRIAQITQFDSAASAVIPGRDPFLRTSGYYNGAGGTSRGAELSVEVRPHRSALLRGSYWYTNADTNQDTAVRGFFSALSVPAQAWTAFWHQDLGRRTDVTFDLYHSGDYYNSLFAAGRARAYHYAGVTKLDAVFSRQLRDADSYTLRWHAKADNLLNRRYFENGFQAPRATFLTGLRIAFK